MYLPKELQKYEPFFGQWYADKLIGKGSYGSVYRIVREEFGDRYEAALKWLPLPQDEDQITTFRNRGIGDTEIQHYYRDMMLKLRSEIRLMNEFRGNGHIVSMEDHLIQERTDTIGFDVLIRMELLAPLPQLTSSLYIKDVIQLGIDLCQALEDCSIRGIIHRDIKPDNIFRSSLGAFKLGDFGVARQLEASGSALSRRGTPLYMAPEVWLGKSYSAQVDLYSLGLVLYELLNAQTIPFARPTSGILSISDRDEAFEKRMRGDPLAKPLQGSEQLSKAILKACAYDPLKRWSSAAEFKQALMCCMSDVEISQRLLLSGQEAPAARSTCAPHQSPAASAQTLKQTINFAGMNPPDESAPPVQRPVSSGTETMGLGDAALDSISQERTQSSSSLNATFPLDSSPKAGPLNQTIPLEHPAVPSATAKVAASTADRMESALCAPEVRTLFPHEKWYNTAWLIFFVINLFLNTLSQSLTYAETYVALFAQTIIVSIVTYLGLRVHNGWIMPNAKSYRKEKRCPKLSRWW